MHICRYEPYNQFQEENCTLNCGVLGLHPDSTTTHDSKIKQVLENNPRWSVNLKCYCHRWTFNCLKSTKWKLKHCVSYILNKGDQAYKRWEIMPTCSRCSPKAATKNKSTCQSDLGLGHLNVAYKKASVFNMGFAVLTPSLKKVHYLLHKCWCLIL